MYWDCIFKSVSGILVLTNLNLKVLYVLQPFDVNSVEMKVLFPKMYPEEPMEVTVIGDDVMPKTLRR